MPKAFITGITGQDGSYLAELLLDKGYEVMGLYRRASSPNFSRIAHIKNEIKLVEGDITDYASCFSLLNNFRPNEVYNLAAQSHVKSSFDQPFYTTQVDYLGCLNLLEICKNLKLDMMSWGEEIKFYQASTSEMYGSNYTNGWLDVKKNEPISPFPYMQHEKVPFPYTITEVRTEYHYQDEFTPFAPNSPYAIAKLAAHHAVRLYREAYGLHASCGILFNHESPRRGDEFVTKKITNYVRKAKHLKMTGWPWMDNKLKLGNVKAQRDWGYAPNYVEAMWLMLQQDDPDDYVIATRETHSVEDFLSEAFGYIGEDWTKFVEFDRQLERPSEVPFLRGSAQKAKEKLGWTPKTTFKELVRMMVDNE